MVIFFWMKDILLKMIFKDTHLLKSDAKFADEDKRKVHCRVKIISTLNSTFSSRAKSLWPSTHHFF